jgi:hypothetical protein
MASDGLTLAWKRVRVSGRSPGPAPDRAAAPEAAAMRLRGPQAGWSRPRSVPGGPDAGVDGAYLHKRVCGPPRVSRRL